MKKSFILGLFLLSNLSFAQTLPVEEGALVIKAIRESLTYKDLNCKSLLGEGEEKASNLNWVIFNEAEVTIQENEQPVITIVKNQTEDIEAVGQVTTNPEFTEVVHLRVTRNKLTKETRNVGTIIRPRYEVGVVRKVIEDLDCR